MNKSKHIFFILFVFILIVSEYFFLQEVFGKAHLINLIFTGAGVLAGIVGTVTIIRKFY